MKQRTRNRKRRRKQRIRWRLRVRAGEKIVVEDENGTRDYVYNDELRDVKIAVPLETNSIYRVVPAKAK